MYSLAAHGSDLYPWIKCPKRQQNLFAWHWSRCVRKFSKFMVSSCVIIFSKLFLQKFSLHLINASWWSPRHFWGVTKSKLFLRYDTVSFFYAHSPMSIQNAKSHTAANSLGTITLNVLSGKNIQLPKKAICGRLDFLHMFLCKNVKYCHYYHYLGGFWKG